MSSLSSVPTRAAIIVNEARQTDDLDHHLAQPETRFVKM
jgi:hypothetical protein